MRLSPLKLLALLALCSVLGACASTPQQNSANLEREAAMQRWVSCVDRQSVFGTISETLTRVELYCEGHRRDLLATYPAHLERQINTVLAQRTQERAAEYIASNLQDGSFPVTLK